MSLLPGTVICADEKEMSGFIQYLEDIHVYVSYTKYAISVRCMSSQVSIDAPILIHNRYRLLVWTVFTYI